MPRAPVGEADVELGCGVVAACSASAFRSEDAVRSDDGVGIGIAHEKMVAEGIEIVGVDSARDWSRRASLLPCR